MTPPDEDGPDEGGRTDDSGKTGKRGRRQVRDEPKRPPKGETLDGLLDGAARACRERGRADTAQALQRLTKRDGE